MPEDAKRLIGHTYVIAFDLGNGRSIQVNGNLYADDDPAAINGKFDTMMNVLERQRARTAIEILEAELRERQKRMDDIEFHIATVQAQLEAFANKVRKAPGDDNAFKSLEAALANHKLNRERIKADIDEGAANLVAGRAKAA